MRLALILLMLPTVAFGECQDVTLLKCQIAGTQKVLEICIEGSLMTYRFGPPADVELELTRPLKAASYRPWGGAFTAPREELNFRNDDINYTVWWRANPKDSAGPGDAGIFVTQQNKLLSTQQCVSGEPSFDFSAILAQRLRRAGLCWDAAASRWSPDICP